MPTAEGLYNYEELMAYGADCTGFAMKGRAAACRLHYECGYRDGLVAGCTEQSEAPALFRERVEPESSVPDEAQLAKLTERGAAAWAPDRMAVGVVTQPGPMPGRQVAPFVYGDTMPTAGYFPGELPEPPGAP